MINSAKCVWFLGEPPPWVNVGILVGNLRKAGKGGSNSYRRSRWRKEKIFLLKENINMARIMEGNKEDLSSSREGGGCFFVFFKKCVPEWEFPQQRSRILIMNMWSLKSLSVPS